MLLARVVLVAVAVASNATVVLAQAPGSVRRIAFERRPLAAQLRVSDRHVVITHPTQIPSFGFPDESRSFVSSLLEWNQIVLIARVAQKEPQFLNLKSRQEFKAASAAEANWIGSRITLDIERVIQNETGMSIKDGGRLTFIEDGDGSAMMNGVRVDCETPWLHPVVAKKRYLISAALDNGQFVATGMWTEPIEGLHMRSQVRHTRPDAPGASTADDYNLDTTPFRDWNINQAASVLDLEVTKRRQARESIGR